MEYEERQKMIEYLNKTLDELNNMLYSATKERREKITLCMEKLEIIYRKLESENIRKKAK